MQLDYNKIFINTEIEDFGEIFSEPFYRGYIEGFIEGFNQGVKEEKRKMDVKIISYGLKQNLSLEEISSFVEISVDEVKQCIKEIN